MTSYRIHSETGERLTTAVPLSSGTVLQVYPVKAHYATREEWFTAWNPHGGVQMTHRLSRRPAPRTGPSRVVRMRLAREMTEFIDPEFLKQVEEVNFRSPGVVRVTTLDGDTYSINRCTDFLKPPVVRKNGELYNACDSQWSPAYTSSKWFLMLALTTHD